MNDVEIQLRNVNMSYTDNDGNEKVILNNINLDIHKGEFISLLGSSGCGKTTLLRIIADLIKPISGEVNVGGLSAEEARKKHKYGMVFQSPVLYEWRTVRENIALPLEILKKPRKEIKEIVDKQLKIVDLEGYADSYPHELSGGMQQRVGIARALALDPDILLMDEPFSALDEFTKQSLHSDLLRIWRNSNKTIIFVTHNIFEAVYLSDRICILSAHPARLAAVNEIKLPRPRSEATKRTEEFHKYVSEIQDIFEAKYYENSSI